MNFTAFSTAGAAGTHFVTTSGQIPVTKIQQNVGSTGHTLPQVVGMVGGVSMGDGVQYVRALEGGATLQATPQIISLPITLPGSKPGDPQPTVQIQVLNPNILQAQQQPKYQMQIPIQGFHQGGAVLTVAYSPEANEAGGLQLVGNALPEGLQVLTPLPQEMHLVQPSQLTDSKEHVQQALQQQQLFITQNHQIVINGGDASKGLNNNTTIDNNNDPSITSVIVKEEFEENNDEESSQSRDTGESISLQMNSQSHHDLLKYLNQLPPQQTQALPAPLQQFLRLNTGEVKKSEPVQFNIEVRPIEHNKTDNIDSEDGSLPVQNKKKKKYRKKPSKPARPKPGQVVIATAADGSAIYCCPECQMAYPEKEQLEMHLTVHKIERRFICGLCGAGLKRKEHLERHKLGHNPERPYVCGVCHKGFKRREHLNLHAVIHSGIKTEMCNLCGKGFYRKDHLRKHTRAHETRRQREAATAAITTVASTAVATTTTTTTNTNMMPEITIHVPSGANVPVQINIPDHIVSSLAAAQHATQQHDDEPEDCKPQLDPLFTLHT